MPKNSWSPTRLTAFHRKHLALKAKMVENHGWLRPEYYEDEDMEVAKVLRSVGVCDISPVGKIDVKGFEVESFLKKNFPRVPLPQRPGEVTRALDTETEKNGVDVVYICRLTNDQTLIVVSPISGTSSVLGLEKEAIQSTDGAYTTNVTSVFAGLSLTGPACTEVLSKLTQLNLSSNAICNLSCAQAGLAKVVALIVRSDARKQDGKDVLSFDLYFGRDHGEYVWDAIMDAGREFGISHFGLKAYDKIFHSSTRNT